MSLESEWKNTCRLCAENKLDMLKIFGDEGKKRKIANKLRLCLPVLVYKTDPLPKNICQFCAARLDDIYEFREYCLDIYKKMHCKLLSNKDIKTVNIFLDAMNNSVDPCKVNLCTNKSRAPLPPLVPLPITSNTKIDNKLQDELSINTIVNNDKASVAEEDGEDDEEDDNDVENKKNKSFVDLTCDVQIKEEPGVNNQGMALTEDDDDDDFNNENNYDDDDLLTDVNLNGNKTIDAEKKTSILKQALTGNLSVNNCQELSKKKLTSKWWCLPCNSYFKTKEALIKHMHQNCPRSYTCGKCTQVFKSVEELAKHEGTNHLKITLDFDETVKECHQCDREFVSWEMLRHHRIRDHVGCSLELGTSTCHVELHNSDTSILNNDINNGFAIDDDDGKKKEEFIKSIKSLTCPTCGKTCTQQSALSNHLRTHEPKKHKCEECGRSFGLLIRLETHRLSEHNNQQSSSPVMTSVEQEEALNAEREAREAKMTGNRRRKYSETIDNDDLLTDNQSPAKKQNNNSNSLKNVARCGICQQWFNDHTTMLTHLQTHSDNITVSHKHNKTLAINNKNKHENTHVVDKTYHCSKCNKIFFKEFSLMTHQCSPLLTIEKIPAKRKIRKQNFKKYGCSKCDACFNSSQSRNSHMKVHAPSKTKKNINNGTEESKKIVPELSQGTSLLLEPKIVIEEPEPPAPIKRTLIKTANGYRCGVCQSPFVLRELAVAHLRSAHPVMPYQCPYCKKRFTTQYTFSHHIKEQHPDESEK
ncbi:hypothetical protein HCN44_010621 [Aphidius gifuensis]|uniref:Uncharacterized protein n=1 Tax=Aphidius gifuensis TaxID=684658 RepID=A0A835CT07_APHGI|nr:hypothetical protein HCN44_010621 [Aphidius gifuensis]